MEDAWIKDKLELLETHIGDIKVTLALNTQSLVEHMRRTEHLESRVKPLETHAAMFSGVFKAGAILVGGISAILGIIVSIIKILGKH